MGMISRIKGLFASPSETIKGYPMVTARVSKEEDRLGLNGAFSASLSTIATKFPYEFYSVIDNLSLIDPYVSKYIYSTVSLGNSGHNLEIDTTSEAEAAEIIQVANDLVRS